MRGHVIRTNNGVVFVKTATPNDGNISAMGEAMQTRPASGVCPRHLNLVTVVKSVRHPDNSVEMHAEYCDGGSLTDFLQTSLSSFRNKVAKAVVRQVVEGIYYRFKASGRLPMYLTTNDIFLRKDGAVKVAPYFVNRNIYRENLRKLEGDLQKRFSDYYAHSCFTPPEYLLSDGSLLHSFSEDQPSEKTAVWIIGVVVLSILLGQDLVPPDFDPHAKGFDLNNYDAAVNEYKRRQMNFRIIVHLINSSTDVNDRELTNQIPDPALRALLKMSLQAAPNSRATLAGVREYILSGGMVNDPLWADSLVPQNVMLKIFGSIGSIVGDDQLPFGSGEVSKVFDLLNADDLESEVLNAIYRLDNATGNHPSFEVWKAAKINSTNDKMGIHSDVRQKPNAILRCLTYELHYRMSQKSSQISAIFNEALYNGLTPSVVFSAVRSLPDNSIVKEKLIRFENNFKTNILPSLNWLSSLSQRASSDGRDYCMHWRNARGYEQRVTDKNTDKNIVDKAMHEYLKALEANSMMQIKNIHAQVKAEPQLSTYRKDVEKFITELKGHLAARHENNILPKEQVPLNLVFSIQADLIKKIEKEFDSIFEKLVTVPENFEGEGGARAYLENMSKEFATFIREAQGEPYSVVDERDVKKIEDMYIDFVHNFIKNNKPPFVAEAMCLNNWGRFLDRNVTCGPQGGSSNETMHQSAGTPTTIFQNRASNNNDDDGPVVTPGFGPGGNNGNQ